MLRISFLYCLVFMLTSPLFAEDRDLRLTGSVAGVGSGFQEVTIDLSLFVGSNLPPDSEFSPFLHSWNTKSSGRGETSVVNLKPEIIKNLNFEFDDLLVWGVIKSVEGEPLRYVPISRVVVQGNEKRINLRVVNNLNRFFRESFPFTPSTSRSDDQMARLRAMQKQIDFLLTNDEITADQFEALVFTFKRNISYVAEGDPSVVLRVFEYLGSIGESLSDSTLHSQYVEEHARILNKILRDISDRPIRGRQLHERTIEELLLIYSGRLFEQSFREADQSIAAANDLDLHDHCIRLSTTVLRAIAAAGRQKRGDSTVLSDLGRLGRSSLLNSLTQATECASKVRIASGSNTNSARLNAQALAVSAGGLEMMAAFNDAVRALDQPGIVNLSDRGAGNIAKHFQTFDEVLNDVSPNG
ncbi:hypothetical protein [Pseudaestuariivita rosea]|uniref:hypothetical protein n=1 Tax=Pseudaestuariivita rosea TaxID=2763263 RepID=UPI001ABA870A|nr:hypothetical protein [Pseudaestuariivita rosea]